MGTGDEGSRTIYTRRTIMWGGQVLDEVGESSSRIGSGSIRWILVRGKDCICGLSSDKRKMEDGVLMKFFVELFEEECDPIMLQSCLSAINSDDSDKIKNFAIVSVVLAKDEGEGICDLKDVVAYLREKKAINFLHEQLRKYARFTYEETLKIGFTALKNMVGSFLDPDDVEICVVRKGESPKSLPNTEIAEISKRHSINRDWPVKWKARQFGDPSLCDVDYSSNISGRSITSLFTLAITCDEDSDITETSDEERKCSLGDEDSSIMDMNQDETRERQEEGGEGTSQEEKKSRYI